VVVGTVISERHPQVAFAKAAAQAQAANDGKLRIIIFGAHPMMRNIAARVWL